MNRHDLFDDAFRLSHTLHRRVTQLGEWVDTADLCDTLSAVQARLTEAEREAADEPIPRRDESETGIGVTAGLMAAGAVYLLIGILIWQWFAS